LNDNDFKKRIKDQFNNSRQERTKVLGENQSKEIEKRILLQSIDMNWKSHIQYLEQLRQVCWVEILWSKGPFGRI
jgi:preprotein translocase subunit SecA